MDLILLQKVTNLGGLGDKVKVKPGYGRNYLVPQGRAVAATEANLADFDKRRAEYEAKANQQLTGAEGRQAQLENASVTIKANASPEGKLFGSVGPRDIAEAFTAAGMAIEKSEVVMAEGPIRHIGEFDVQIHLHADINATVKVIVAATHAYPRVLIDNAEYWRRCRFTPSAPRDELTAETRMATRRWCADDENTLTMAQSAVARLIEEHPELVTEIDAVVVASGTTMPVAHPTDPTNRAFADLAPLLLQQLGLKRAPGGCLSSVR